MIHNTVAENSVVSLITIPISHYCEKARWALEWLEIPYIEEKHAPVFHRLATRPRGGQSVPVLVTEAGAFANSTDILNYLDAIARTERRLYPKEPELRREVEQLEELFDAKLGVYTRAWGYFHRLDEREWMQRVWSKGTPLWEQFGLAIAFPFIIHFVRKVYKINAANAANALQGIKEIFQTVSDRLQDGRSYLVGSELSAADITFAALAAPIILPPEHPIKPLALEEMPREVAAVVREMRATPAGAHALRLYREHRHSR